MAMRLTGLDRTRRTLQKYAAKKHANFNSGIIAAALFVEASAVMELTNTLYAQPEPPEKERKRTGNLRASRFTIWTNATAINAATSFAPDPFAKQDVTEGHAFAMGEAKALVNDHAMETGSFSIYGVRSPQFWACVAFGAYYALYVHEGTEYMPAYKWLTNALNKDRDLIMAVVRGGMK